MRIAFVVNPIAGMGGSVGLKGTDGPEIVEEALRRGAKPMASSRAERALLSLKGRVPGLEFITCSGPMGSDELRRVGIDAQVVYQPGKRTSSEDTKRAVKEFLRHSPDLIIFTGGDGTARDMLDVVGRSTPVVGIPAGVKMHSAVFAVTPASLGDLVESYGETGRTKDAEVMDVDEASFRRGVLQARLYGYCRIPDDAVNMQSSKVVYSSGSADEEASEIGHYIADEMVPGVAYILGPGSTVAAITRHLGLEKTLLGVDVVKDGCVILKDATEAQLLDLLEDCDHAFIVVTPIGSQGFVFGRGNQQISAEVLRKVGLGQVLVVATLTKLKNTPLLRVDTSDKELDASFRGAIRVVIGFRRRRLMHIA